MFDVVIRGGMVLDGTGAPAFRADVGLAGGQITAVGLLPSAAAAAVLDATRRFVMPGFIDAHVHGDAAVFDAATQLAVLRQGVTTLVLGQDGLSFAPAGSVTLDYVTRYLAAVNGARRAPSGDELAAMRGMVESGLADGAAGLSSGLEYVPGGYADEAELAAVCAPLAEAGLPYVSHMRGYEASAGPPSPK